MTFCVAKVAMLSIVASGIEPKGAKPFVHLFKCQVVAHGDSFAPHLVAFHFVEDFFFARARVIDDIIIFFIFFICCIKVCIEVCIKVCIGFL